MMGGARKPDLSGESRGIGSSAEPDIPAFADMIRIPGGTFQMGSDHHYPEEAPAHEVRVDGFWMDPTTVTNRDFARFVDETGIYDPCREAGPRQRLSGRQAGAPRALVGHVQE